MWTIRRSSAVFNMVFKDRLYYRFMNIIFQFFLFCLFLLFTMSAFNLNNFFIKTSSKVTFYAFLKKDLLPEQIETIQKIVVNWPEVNKVRTISREDGLAILKKSLGKESAILNTVDANPLPITIEINIKPEYTQKQDLSHIKDRLRRYDQFDWVDSTEKFIGAYLGLKDFLTYAFLVATITLITLILFSLRVTTKSLLHKYHDAIALLKLLGASSGFIFFPFVLEGLLETMISASLAAAACFYMEHFLIHQLAIIGINILPLPVLVYIFFIIFVSLIGILGGLSFKKIREL